MHPTPIMISQFHEKLLFGIGSLIAAAAGWASSILSEGEFRWLAITFTSSILMGTLVSLIVKSPSDTIKVTVGRAGVAIFLGTVATRELVLWWGIDAFERDSIRLAGVAAGVTIVGMTVGYPLLLLLNLKGKDWAKWVLGLLGRLVGKSDGK
ncbi:hypothetical protein [Luteolibacter sp. Populi]|uniref:hypothetical protein n=1 Tax=Luteolibacter sp. Populi TaxID=3230487 RepID=UPI003464EE21